MGKNLIKALKDQPKIKGVILTPLSGPVTQEAWTNASKEGRLAVYLEPVLETGGYLKPEGFLVEDA